MCLLRMRLRCFKYIKTHNTATFDDKIYNLGSGREHDIGINH